MTTLDTPEQPVGLIDVPISAEVRKRLRERASHVDWRQHPGPVRPPDLANMAEQLLVEEGLATTSRNWLMVILASNYWRESVAAVPFQRRLLLLPDSFDFADDRAAARNRRAEITRWRQLAERLGYRIADASHWSAIEPTIRSGEVHAVLGVSDLRGLEKAVDRVMTWGVPCMAEPLLEDAVDLIDQDFVERMIRLPFKPNCQESCGEYPRLIREARELFRPESLASLLPKDEPAFLLSGVRLSRNEISPRPVARNGCSRPGQSSANVQDPLQGTAEIAADFLSRGGKYFRPFITLATFNAVANDRTSGGGPSLANGRWTNGVKRTAMSIEVFHKASLVHDDIEDDDDFRYGELAVHKKYGIPTAINVGDYLVGLGYRLVSGSKDELGGDTVADILNCLAGAHQRLSEGQGAELLWRDSPDKSLSPTESLQVYALKTAPAFEVAFFSGLRLAGPVGEEAKLVRAYSEYLGVAFQILNDLQDWCENESNKGAPGGDILQGRPTLLWALALQAANIEQRRSLMSLISAHDERAAADRIELVRQLYQRLGVFRDAADLVRQLESQAWHVIEQFHSAGIRRLLGYLIGVVLQRPPGLERVVEGSSEAA